VLDRSYESTGGDRFDPADGLKGQSRDFRQSNRESEPSGRRRARRPRVAAVAGHAVCFLPPLALASLPSGIVHPRRRRRALAGARATRGARQRRASSWKTRAVTVLAALRVAPRFRVGDRRCSPAGTPLRPLGCRARLNLRRPRRARACRGGGGSACALLAWLVGPRLRSRRLRCAHCGRVRVARLSRCPLTRPGHTGASGVIGHTLCRSTAGTDAVGPPLRSLGCAAARRRPSRLPAALRGIRAAIASALTRWAGQRGHTLRGCCPNEQGGGAR